MTEVLHTGSQFITIGGNGPSTAVLHWAVIVLHNTCFKTESGVVQFVRLQNNDI